MTTVRFFTRNKNAQEDKSFEINFPHHIPKDSDLVFIEDGNNIPTGTYKAHERTWIVDKNYKPILHIELI